MVHARRYESRRTETTTGRLQGFAPVESPLPTDGGLDRRRPDALMGFCLSRDITPAPGPVFDTEQLPWAWTARTYQRPEPQLVRALPFEAYRRGGCPVSLETERPSGFPTLSRHSTVRE